MKAGKYSVKEMFVNRYVQQIIIPEIQRDYVWEEEQVIGLLTSIKKDYETYCNVNNTIPQINTNDASLKKAFKEFYQKRNNASNIGFIYAYNDEQYTGKYFLIDGQQRITTIYLTLLALASLNQVLNERFKATYLLENNLKLDYKVRESAHQFLNEFVKNVLKGKDNLKDENWYYKNQYNTDKTIQSLLGNLEIIKKFFKDQPNLNIVEFYNYLENYVDFWYFDTNISEQGEELYIYMNARGEQMQGNENMKADLLGRVNATDEKNKYGKIWEDWQDIFWKNKGQSNENADSGFNEFLACISGLENYINGEKNFFYKKEEFEKNYSIKVNQIIKTIDFSIIEKYINGLKFLEQHKQEFKNLYNYSNWIDKCLEEIWRILNNEKTNWYANYYDANRATERSKMVFLWSILYYLSITDLSQKPIIEVFRVLRMFYLRYNNFNRSVSTLKKTIDTININGIFDTIDNEISDDFQDDGTDIKSKTDEEILKIDLLIKHKSNFELQKQYEEIIWQIEDHKFNLNGRDVGSTNISYLINDFANTTLDQLRLISVKFFEIFPEDQNEYKIIQNVLLYYGKYWYRVSPYYYSNYRFNNWRRIIRNIGENQEDVRVSFQLFFTDFLEADLSIQEFLADKRINIINKEVASNVESRLLWYNQYLDNNMWLQGNHIAFSNGTPCSLPDWENNDKIFNDNYIIYNIKGNLQGGSPKELFELLNENEKLLNQVKIIS